MPRVLIGTRWRGVGCPEEVWFPNLDVASGAEAEAVSNEADLSDAGADDDVNGTESDVYEVRKKHRARKRPRSELKVKKAKPLKQKKATTARPRSVAKEIVNDGDNQEVFSFRGKNSKIRNDGIVT